MEGNYVVAGKIFELFEEVKEKLKVQRKLEIRQNIHAETNMVAIFFKLSSFQSFFIVFPIYFFRKKKIQT